MDLRTYRGNSMADALAKVRSDLGSDAVILHARALRVGGILGFGARSLVEITAAPSSAGNLPPKTRAGLAPPRSNSANILPPAASASGKTANGKTASGTASKPASSLSKSSISVPPLASPAPPSAASAALAKAPLPTDPTQRAARALLDSLGVSQEEAAGLVLQPSPAPGTSSRPTQPATAAPTESSEPSPQVAPRSARLAQPVTFAPTDSAARDALHDELASIKRLVGQVLQCSRHTAARVAGQHATSEFGDPHTLGTPATSGVPAPSTPGRALTSAALSLGGISDPLMNWYLHLVDQGVNAESAELVIAACRDELSSAQAAEPEIVRHTIARHLASRVPCDGSFSLSPAAGLNFQPGSPLVVALVGPTGVGKTTTIAKLAATYKLRGQRRVGLITCDTYRIAAVDQLRTYANIIGLPIKVALTPEELAAARRSLSDCDVLLIDTAGRSHNDARRLDELRSFLAAARPHQTHLALSLAAGPPSLHRAVQRFAALSPDRLLLTKLDECESPGLILDLARTSSLPVSFITMGQEVPDQIEAATPERLARFMMEGIASEMQMRETRIASPAGPAAASERSGGSGLDAGSRSASDSIDHLAGLYHTGSFSEPLADPVIVTRTPALRQGAGA